MAVEVSGTVIAGAAEGRGFGYPTANLALAAGSVRPAAGIYACWVQHGQKRYPGALVSGVNWEAADVPRLEVHLIGFSGDLYGQVLKVEVQERIRDVEQIADAAVLCARIEQDIAAAKKILGV